MIIYMNDALPVILYFLGSILLVVLIILSIKMIRLIDRLHHVIDDVEEKSLKLNGVFDIIDRTADGLSHLSDAAVNVVSNLLNGLLSRKKKSEKGEEENE